MGARSRKRRAARRPRRGQQLFLRSQKGSGWNAGAGRKRRRKRRTVPHRPRPPVHRDNPVHVTLRVLSDVPPMRRGKLFRTIRSCIANCHRATFQVVEYCVMGNHLHLIVEASHRIALSRGMQGLKVRLARQLNGITGRRGTVFAERYHARILRTALEVKNALAYVLGNARRHAKQQGRKLARGWLDPCSSALFFNGWRGRRPVKWSRSVDPWERDAEQDADTLPSTGPPTKPARAWLLTTGWRKHGLLDVNAVPGE